MPESTGGQEYGLTVEKLRTFKGLENVSDEEAENIIQTLKEFARLSISYYHLTRRNDEV